MAEEMKFAMSGFDLISTAWITKAKWTHAKREADRLRVMLLCNAPMRVEAEALERALRLRFEQEFRAAIAQRRQEFEFIVNHGSPEQAAIARANITSDDRQLEIEVPSIFRERQAALLKTKGAHELAVAATYAETGSAEIVRR